VCPICLSALSCAAVYTLPGCGHGFHALCLASTLHQSLLCPLCRLDVNESVCRDVAATLVSDRAHGGGGAQVVADVLADLRSRDAAQPSGASAAAIVAALQDVSRDTDGSRIPFVASILGRSGDVTRAHHPPEVRFAVIDALRATIPHARFHDQNSSANLGVDVLRKMLANFEEEEDLRVKALSALREVCPAGETSVIQTIQQLLEHRRSDERMKRSLADALQVLGKIGHVPSMRAALVALVDQDRDAGVRQIGLSVLRQICPRGHCVDIVEDLIALAGGHPDVDIREYALEILAQAEEIGGEPGLGAAAARLRDRDHCVRLKALTTMRALWPRGDRRAVSTLADVAASRDADDIRRYAIDILSEVAEPYNSDAIVVAARSIGDRDGSVRDAAVRCLRALVPRRGNELAVGSVVPWLHDRDEEIRRSAVEALGYLASSEDDHTVSIIRSISGSSDDSVTKQVSEQALRHIT